MASLKIYGDKSIEIDSTYTDELFKEIILKSIADEPSPFIVDNLLKSIGKNFQINGQPITANDGTVVFTEKEKEFINRWIWEQIWNRKLMIDLTLKKNPLSQSDTIHFIRVD